MSLIVETSGTVSSSRASYSDLIKHRQQTQNLIVNRLRVTESPPPSSGDVLTAINADGDIRWAPASTQSTGDSAGVERVFERRTVPGGGGVVNVATVTPDLSDTNAYIIDAYVIAVETGVPSPNTYIQIRTIRLVYDAIGDVIDDSNINVFAPDARFQMFITQATKQWSISFDSSGLMDVTIAYRLEILLATGGSVEIT